MEYSYSPKLFISAVSDIKQSGSITFFEFPLHFISIVMSQLCHFEQKNIFIFKLNIFFYNNYILKILYSVLFNQNPRENEANSEPLLTF